MLKKFFIILISILLMIGMCGNVNAAELKTSLDIIQKASETKYLENDQGFISKTIVDSNSDTGEVTIELKLSNTAKEVEKTTDTEIFLVIDNSFSMDYAVTEQSTRRELLISAMRTFVNQIYAQSSNVKVGLVRFAGKDSWNSTNSPTLTNGTNLMCNLTKDKSTMLSAITAFENLETKQTATNNSHCESSTNIAAGIKKANDNFSAECTNKIIVLLTDGLPTQDLTFSTTSNNSTIYQNTKNTLLEIGNSGTYIIAMMTGTSSQDEEEHENAQADIESIFGTETNPTTGAFYNVSDANIEEVVSNRIYANVMEKVQNPINTTKIVDYFPEDITDNFDFSYVGSPSIGTTSDSIDTESKTITWDIGTLKGDEVATLKYKLKIKDMKNTELLNKTIATNEKVVLTYKDTESKDYTVELTSSPKIQLSEVKEELTATVSYAPTTNTTGNVVATIKTNKKVNKVDGWTLSDDGKTLTKTYSTNATETVHLVDLDGMTKDVEVKITNITSATSKQDNEKDTTTAKGTLPQTGVNMAVSIASIIAIILVALVLYKKYNSYKDIK